ncbi:MAG TPA: thiamine pyrophosphate-binding protein [Syntrophorhabdaceae bacterium]|nr:thiamine pyrophosphate-binding protein [Syntrophorhabdaceae bacterium]
MQGKQVITSFFEKHGISHIFQLPGLHTLALNACLYNQQTTKTITARHETNLAFMADGYARASGKPGVILVTPGPGLGNIVSGCMESFCDDVPLFIIHIDIDRKDLGKGILHEIIDPGNIFRHFIKESFSVGSAESLPEILDRAYRTCTAGRCGPVLVSIPYSLLDKEVSSSVKGMPDPLPAPLTQDTVEDLRTFLAGLEHLLNACERPVMIGGKGLMNDAASKLVEEICGPGNIPFLTTTGGKGVVSDKHLFSFGSIMAKGTARQIVRSSDLVIAAGTRLRDVDTRRRGVRIGNLVHIDIDDRWMNRNYPAVLQYAADPLGALRGIAHITRGRAFSWDLPRLKEMQRSEAVSMKRSARGYALVDLLRNTIPDAASIVCDLNIPSYWSEYYMPVYHRRSFIMPRGISPIFYSLSAAIGAKTARPELPCLAVCGDGGVLPQIAELATAVRYKIPVVVFVHNNSSFSILENTMRNRYEITGSMDLTNPDFVKLARAFGVKAKRARSLAGLKDIFLRDINWDEPFLVEFVDAVSSPPWD